MLIETYRGFEINTGDYGLYAYNDSGNVDLPCIDGEVELGAEIYSNEGELFNKLIYNNDVETFKNHKDVVPAIKSLEKAIDEYYENEP